ncbi:MAG: hypothetical protein IH901_07955, partial [Proteobacteria bacterium]|nr:hypothetical protein [Pseudomonadota bacterium]
MFENISTFGRLGRTILLGLIFMIAGAANCNGEKGVEEKEPTFSGVIGLGENSYLVIHDFKGHERDEPRFGFITVTSSVPLKYNYTPFDVAKQKKQLDPLPADLESICVIEDESFPNPGKNGLDILVAESGSWNYPNLPGPPYYETGQIYHLRFDGEYFYQDATFDLPRVVDGYNDFAKPNET